MDDITQGEPPVVAQISALRARFGGIDTPGWAKRGGASPRLLARSLMRNMGLDLLPGTFAPVVLTLAALWSAGGLLHLTAIALLCESLALAHIGLCLLSTSADQSLLSTHPDAEAVAVVSRLVGVIALIVACGAIVPLTAIAGMRLLVLAVGGFVLALLAIATRLTRFRYVPFNALLALALGPGLAFAVADVQGRALNGGLALLTAGVGVLFSVCLAERRMGASASSLLADSPRAQMLLRLLLCVIMCAGFVMACLSTFTWRPLDGVVVGSLALPVVAVAATGVGRARGHLAVSLAAMKTLRAHWLLCALLLIGLVGWGAISRWVV